MREPRVGDECSQTFQGRVIIVRRSPEEWTIIFEEAGLRILETIQSDTQDDYLRDDFFIIKPTKYSRSAQEHEETTLFEQKEEPASVGSIIQRR